MRPGLLGAAAAVPAGALLWLIGRNPEREVGALIADPLAQSLFAAVGILLLLIAARERILIRLDAWILPETADQRQALADAAGTLAQAGRITTVGETVTGRCGAVAARPRPCWLRTPPRPARAVSAPRRPASRPCRARRPSSTCWKPPAGPCGSTPTASRRSSPCCRPMKRPGSPRRAPDVIVPVPGPGTDVLGVLVVSRRLDGRLVRSVDLPFLEALGAAAGLACRSWSRPHAPAGRPTSPRRSPSFSPASSA